MPINVLLVEDDLDLGHMYKTRLELSGISVVVKEDGESGVEWLKTNYPDLILLDIMLPGKNGDEILKEIKSNSKTKEIPVIILSSLEFNKKIKQVKEMGAVDYYIKSSVAPSDLVDKINRVVGFSIGKNK